MTGSRWTEQAWPKPPNVVPLSAAIFYRRSEMTVQDLDDVSIVWDDNGKAVALRVEG